jgi:hypothetical protein
LKMLMFTQVVKSFFKEVTSLILWGVSPLYTKMQTDASSVYPFIRFFNG